MLHQEAVASHTPRDHGVTVPKDKHFSLPPSGPRLSGEQGKVSTCTIEVRMVQGEVVDHRACQSNLGKYQLASGWDYEKPVEYWEDDRLF